MGGGRGFLPGRGGKRGHSGAGSGVCGGRQAVRVPGPSPASPWGRCAGAVVVTECSALVRPEAAAVNEQDVLGCPGRPGRVPGLPLLTGVLSSLK